MGELTVRCLEGAAIDDMLDDLARLRIEVFRDWPYLYDGSLDYERWYLGRLAQAPHAIVVGAFARERLIGAATAMPLVHEHADIRAPFEARGAALDTIFYLAESVLLADFRGRGLGHAFFDHRERHARALGFSEAVFCAVERSREHPLRPPAPRSLAPFWRKRGYAPLAGLVCHFPWQDIGDTRETTKSLQFWGRRLDG